MKHLLNKIARLLCLSLALSTLPAVAQNGTPRKYDPSGTIELEKVYHVDLTKNKTLRALGYTEAMLPDSFPAFTEYWRMHGWPRAEMLDLYLFECAWNDVIYGTDGYYGKGFYIRGNYVSQSRAHIIAPSGKYRIRFHPFTALGRYTGGQAQVSSDATGTLLGGTAIEIDHFGWSPRATDRVCLQSTVWGKDYAQVGGIAYQEGVMVEFFRFMGDKNNCPSGVFSTGCTLNEPGEQSGLRYCMAEDFAGAGYSIFNGTPFVSETCSAFNCTGPGFDLIGSNGLCNVRLETPSGDNNQALVRIRPKDGQSVGGGTISINNLKSETRASESGGRAQIPILVEGNMGDLNLTVDGLTADYIGVTCPYLIGGNFTGNQFEISARGIDLRSGVDALFLHGGKGWKLTGGKAYSGNSFTVNDEGLAFRSRANMVLQGGPTVTPPPIDPPPTGGATTATASHTGTENGVLREAKFAVDGNPGTFWISGRSMANGQTFTITFPAGTYKGVTFSVPNGYARSYPRSFTVETLSGTTWTKRGGTFTGQNPTSTAPFPAVNCQGMRITCTSANSDWWGISEIVPVP